MALCWGLDLVVVAGLEVPETRGVSPNPWAEVLLLCGIILTSAHDKAKCTQCSRPQVGRLFSSAHTRAFLFWSTMVGFCFGELSHP